MSLMLSAVRVRTFLSSRELRIASMSIVASWYEALTLESGIGVLNGSPSALPAITARASISSDESIVVDSRRLPMVEIAIVGRSKKIAPKNAVIRIVFRLFLISVLLTQRDVLGT